jgi:7,8-dihydropterin-6-yl-methyl-4-(beta-D-ribofuranosyl)aminobenzene 5'-phosphate synthase
VGFRLSPLWWPVLVVASPVLVPKLIVWNRRYREDAGRTEEFNQARIQQASRLTIPEVEFLELTVLVEEKVEDGFLGAAGVSYLLTTDQGSLLFDLAFGPDKPTLFHNVAKLGLDLSRVDSLVISHLHPDHMGGADAHRSRRVTAPQELGLSQGLPCFLPDTANAPGFNGVVVEEPRLLTSGIATTGPLARSLFFLGFCREQSLIVRVRGKGLVVVCGCGHPTIEVILRMVRCLSSEPLHTITGGLHFPITESRDRRSGIQRQMFFGTGKPPWQRITDDDLSRTISAINDAHPSKVLLSAHDSCDHAIARFEKELMASTSVLKAGKTYRVAADQIVSERGCRNY